MIKQCDFDQILEHMKNISEDSDSYKSIKKCLKEKIQLLFE